MWLIFLAGPLFIVLVIGGLLAGGVYGFILVPIAVIILVGAIVFTMWRAANRPKDQRQRQAEVNPLPHTDHSNTAAAPATPDQLVDAQRQAQ